MVQKYSIAVEEGAYSTTQRQMELQQYLHFKQLGMNVADKTIWRAAFLTNKKRAMQEAEESAQAQQQMQQAQAKIEADEKEASAFGKAAKAQLDIAKSHETIANIAGGKRGKNERVPRHS